jgi:hypothetical protein
MTLPPRFVDLKRSIASSYPDFEARATGAWREIITELDKVNLKCRIYKRLIQNKEYYSQKFCLMQQVPLQDVRSSELNGGRGLGNVHSLEVSGENVRVVVAGRLVFQRETLLTNQ